MHPDAWSGSSGLVAAFQDGARTFFTPRIGWTAWVAAVNALYDYQGTGWVNVTSLSTTVPLLGVNATNRFAVSSSAVLFNHAGSDHRTFVNKAAVASTASVVYQDAFSGRAEVGLTGDDNFHF